MRRLYKEALGNIVPINPKDELPILEPLDDGDIKYLCENGLLVTSSKGVSILRSR